MLSFVTVISGSVFSSLAIAVPSVAKSVSGISIVQPSFIQPDNSGWVKASLVSKRALALSIFWLAKNVLIRGGNQAMGAPSGLSALSAANRSVAAPACRSRFFTFGQLILGSSHFALQISDRSKHGIATPIQRAEKEAEINVEQNEEANHAQTHFLDLVFAEFVQVDLLHDFFLRAGAGGAAAFAATGVLKFTVKTKRAIGMLAPATFTIVSRSSSVLNSTFTSL